MAHTYAGSHAVHSGLRAQIEVPRIVKTGTLADNPCYLADVHVWCGVKCLVYGFQFMTLAAVKTYWHIYLVH